MSKLAFFLLAVLASFSHAQGRLTATPVRPEPGAIIRLTLRDASTDSVIAIRGTLAGEPLHFLPATSRSWHAIGGVPVDAKGRLSALTVVTHASGVVDTLRAAVTVARAAPPKSEPLAVDTQFTAPPDSATRARIAAEGESARDVGRRAHAVPPLWTASFAPPRSTRITSQFGAGRLFNGRVTSRHLGVDFAGKEGEPVHAANRGVVALVDTFLLAGNVVFIDHGGGVVTGYFHLSKPLVAVGDTVARGQIIGLVGKTGRVTGPHLHWSARYGTLAVNPADLLKLDRRWYAAGPAVRARAEH